ncbi:MAG TPA: peptidylprolyl isomerase [Methylophilus sp.]|nr:peptidylprolyl isomerase [Methylophilus sp.]HQQ33630.1 peptidylprolyl isomerase [Methylophilus sp.]
MRFTVSLIVAYLLICTNIAFAGPLVEFETSQGNFTVELYPEKAPKTVANFLQYVKDGFYANTIFHRVINNFMIQGGGFERDMTEKTTRAPIANESDNGLLNQPGTIAMARTMDPNSATSQFFINLVDNVFLNYQSPEPELIGYCVFGKVIKGFEVVKKIGSLPTGNQSGFSDVPIRPITIKQVKLLSEPAH